MPTVLMPKPVHKPKPVTEPLAPQSIPEIWAWVGAYGLLFLYYYSFLDYGLNLWDEGALAHGTLRTFRGEMAMRDFNPVGYLPGRYLYAAWFFDWFGVSLHSLRLSVAWFTPAMVLMVYSLARRLMPPSFALAAGALTLSSPGMYYNRFYPFFVILIMFAVVRWLEKPGQRRGLALLMAVVLCVPFKMEISIFSVVIISVLWWLRRSYSEARKILPGREEKPERFPWVGWMVVGVGTVMIGYYFWRYDVAAKFIGIVFASHSAWGNPFPDLFPLGNLWREGGAHALFERLLFYAPLVAYGLLLVLVGRQWMKGESSREKHWILLTVAMFGLCAYGLVVWRAGFDNLIRTLPPFHIALVYLLYLIHRKCTGAETTPKGKTRWAPEKALVYFLALAPVWIYLYEMNVTQGFYVGSIGAVRHNTTKLEYERMQVWTNSYEAEWVRKILDKVESATRPQDTLLALPLNSLFNFLADRRNPLKYDWILPGMLDEKAQEEVVRQLKAQLPRVIIYSDIAIDGREDRRFSKYAPIINRFITSNYQLWETVGLFHVLIPQGPAFRSSAS